MGAGYGFHKMAGSDAFFVADGGQIHARVPAEKKRKVLFELAGQGAVQWIEAECCEK